MKVIKKYKIAKLLLVALFSFATITILSAPVSAAQLNAKNDFTVGNKQGVGYLKSSTSLIQTTDGGYLTTGIIGRVGASDMSKDGRAGIAKRNSSGELEWVAYSQYNGYFYDAIQESDSYIAVGYQLPNPG